MAEAKPDCTGKRFGRLVVLGKAEVVKKNGQSRRLWLLQCDCGKKIKIHRGDFDRSPLHRVSCGCARKDNSGVKPQNLTGKKFGNLTALKIIPDEQISPSDFSKVWLCKCDCGNLVEKSTKRLHLNYGLHCGKRNNFHIPYSNYPVCPNPIPKEVGDLIKKYLYLTNSKAWKNTDRELYKEQTEETRIDRLIRACWIIVYRKHKGDNISNIHEKRFIRKHLRYCQTDVYWQNKLEKNGGLGYDIFGKQKSIGSVMTNKKTLPSDCGIKDISQSKLFSILAINGKKV